MTTPARKSRRSLASTPPTDTAPATIDPDAAAAYRLEEQVGFRLRTAHQRATEIFGVVMAPFDVTPMQLAALVKLQDLGTVSQNLLGRHVAMDPATTFGVVGRLVKRGLVAQTTDPADARLILLTLTEAGLDLVHRIKMVGAEVSRRTLEPLNDVDARTLLALLAKIG